MVNDSCCSHVEIILLMSVCAFDSFTTRWLPVQVTMFIKAVSAEVTSIVRAVVKSHFQRSGQQCILGTRTGNLCWGAVWKNILMSESYEWSGVCGDNDKARYVS